MGCASRRAGQAGEEKRRKARSGITEPLLTMPLLEDIRMMMLRDETDKLEMIAMTRKGQARIASMLTDEKVGIPMIAADILRMAAYEGYLSESSVEALEGALSNVYTKRHAAAALGAFYSLTHSTQRLRALVNNPDPEIRESALAASAESARERA